MQGFMNCIKRYSVSVAREVMTIVVAAVIGVIGINVYTLLNPQAIDNAAGNEDSSREIRRRIATRPLVTVGQVLELRGAPLEVSEQGIVLMTQPSCGACRDSVPFHRRVIEEMTKRGLPIYIAVPDIPSARAYLKEAQFPSDFVYSWQDLSHRPRVTPTVVFLGNGGTVRGIWPGAFTPAEEVEFLRALQKPGLMPDPVRFGRVPEDEISADLLLRLRQEKRVSVVSILERRDFGLTPNTLHGIPILNVPLQELSVRAPIEFGPSITHVVDCSYLAVDECRSALDIIRTSGLTALIFSPHTQALPLTGPDADQGNLASQ